MRAAINTAIGVMVVTLFCGTGIVTAAESTEPPQKIDNLERVDNAKADIAYKDPQADFTRYHRIMLDDLDLSNVNIVQPSQSSSTLGRRAWELTDKDREKLRVAFRDAMTKELSKGYPVVAESAEDVLRLSATLTDLAPTAPKDDLKSRGGGRTYIITEGAGALAIAVIVRDSQSGEVLAIVKDARQAGNANMASLNTSVSNLADVRRAFAGWAREIRKRMDIIHQAEPSQR